MANPEAQSVSVIIPAFNEEATIVGVLEAACRTSVAEIIVVDDASTDRTYHLAARAGLKDPRVVVLRHDRNQGPGGSRCTGLRASAGAVVAFLDADIQNPSPAIIKNTVAPIVRGEADFVLAAFDNVGRVTELTAKPLIATCFPELKALRQPLSGQFASLRRFLFPDRIERGNAMLGIVLDAYLAGARLVDVDIGPLVHAKRALELKQQQALLECQALIKRFVEAKLTESI